MFALRFAKSIMRLPWAFIVTGWQDERDGDAITLPVVEGSLCLIASFRGYRFRLLDLLLKKLTAQDEHFIFTQPLLFWYRLANVISARRNKTNGNRNAAK